MNDSTYYAWIRCWLLHSITSHLKKTHNTLKSTPISYHYDSSDGRLRPFSQLISKTISFIHPECVSLDAINVDRKLWRFSDTWGDRGDDVVLCCTREVRTAKDNSGHNAQCVAMDSLVGQVMLFGTKGIRFGTLHANSQQPFGLVCPSLIADTL